MTNFHLDNRIEVQTKQYLLSEEYFLQTLESLVKIKAEILDNPNSSEEEKEVVDVLTDYFVEAMQAKMFINANCDELRYLINKITTAK